LSITTEQLVAQAKEAADLTNVTDYVTDAQWIAWCNDGVRELHRFVTNKFRATYYRTLDFTIAAGDSQQTLPTNFWKLRGLDIDPDTSRRREVRPYNFAERNRYRQNSLRDIETWCNDRWYSLLGSRLLQIQAQEQASGDYRLYYVPLPKVLAASRAITLDPGDDTSDGAGHLHFDFANQFTLADIGSAITFADTFDTVDSTSFTITAVASSGTELTVTPSPTTTLFDGTPTATMLTTLDDELDPYSEYVWLTAAIKSLTKEESFAQANLLKDQRNLIRADLLEAVEADQGGPATIIDTDDVEVGW